MGPRYCRVRLVFALTHSRISVYSLYVVWKVWMYKLPCTYRTLTDCTQGQTRSSQYQSGNDRYGRRRKKKKNWMNHGSLLRRPQWRFLKGLYCLKIVVCLLLWDRFHSLHWRENSSFHDSSIAYIRRDGTVSIGRVAVENHWNTYLCDVYLRVVIAMYVLMTSWLCILWQLFHRSQLRMISIESNNTRIYLKFGSDTQILVFVSADPTGTRN